MSYLTQELAALLMWCFLAASFYLRSQPGKSPLFDPQGYLSTDTGAAQALLAPEHLAAGGGTEEEEEAGGAARAAVLATVAVQSRRARGAEASGGGEGGRHVIVDAGGGEVALAERLPPAAAFTPASPLPAAYK